MTTTKYIGVTYLPPRRKPGARTPKHADPHPRGEHRPWLARLTVRGVTYYGGQYYTPEDAALAYNRLFAEHMPKMLNTVERP